jgi:S-DNA-T family DNA segregation ATPase FtsK/SpoIIIE
VGPKSNRRAIPRRDGAATGGKNQRENNALTLLPPEVVVRLKRMAWAIWGLFLVTCGVLVAVALVSYTPRDPSINTATPGPVHNLLGMPGATLADLLVQSFGLVSVFAVMVLIISGLRQVMGTVVSWVWLRVLAMLGGSMVLAMTLTPLPTLPLMPLPAGNGGFVGQLMQAGSIHVLDLVIAGNESWAALWVWILPVLALAIAVPLLSWGLSLSWQPVFARYRRAAEAAEADQNDHDERRGGYFDTEMTSSDGEHPVTAAQSHSDAEHDAPQGFASRLRARASGLFAGADESRSGEDDRLELEMNSLFDQSRAESPATNQDLPPWVSAHANPEEAAALSQEVTSPPRTIVAPPPPPKATKRDLDARQGSLLPDEQPSFSLPSLDVLALPSQVPGSSIDEESLDNNARMLERVLADFGVKGQIVEVRPGPVVTLYELDPAPGTKTARVVGLADDIARSMSAVSVRIAVVPGKSTIGIELPNQIRETVNFRELLAADAFHHDSLALCLALGRDIGGTPVYVDLSRMPHLLIAGTTGSGKSVAVNTMICSLLYRMTPDQCRFIMIDPKMLELSVYDGIPHLLTPVVTDPGKAVVALKWAVKEMENRYRAMSSLGVRNIAGYNARLRDAAEKGQSLTRTVQTGFDPETGQPEYEEQELDTTPLPFVVVIVDEMADLMLVAGKDVEAAIQRLAQMARAAGIHLIMATQRPSVDVITGTIKANFPTRISFQVTSKIDSRTILGEQGAEQLLGQGDMLYMAGGGRITRVHGPFVADGEVEAIVAHLSQQGGPNYLDAVTDEAEQGSSAMLDALTGGEGTAEGGGSSDTLFDQAVALVARDRKASISYVQRCLQIGYNRAARIIERMEQEGMVSKANRVGKREVLLPPPAEEQF